MKQIHLTDDVFFSIWVYQHQRSLRLVANQVAENAGTEPTLNDYTDTALHFYENHPRVISFTWGAVDIEHRYCPNN